MTTLVIISSPTPNHNLVRVRAGTCNPDGTFVQMGSDTVLLEGQSTVRYVYGNVVILADEISKVAK